MAATAPVGQQHQPRPPTPIVGRAREQDQLREQLAAAVAGQGGLVLIGGEAGIGKTALVRWLADEAVQHDHGALVLSGGCYDLTVTPPYGPWLDAFERYQPAADAAPHPRFTPHATTKTQTWFDTIQTFLTGIAASQPLVLILEDVHWSDPASLDLLRYIARRIREQHLLLVVTYRNDELSHGHPLDATLPLLIREAHGTRIDLRRLDSSAVDQLVGDRYGLPASDQRQLVAYLERLGGGNPLFIEELLRTLEAERRLRSSGESWNVEDLSAIRVPPLLRQLIDRRLSQLSTLTRDALTVGAIVGQDLPLDLWGALTGVTPDQLADIVDESLRAHMLEELPTGTGLRFTHALIREAIHASMALPRRRVWHRRLAEMSIASTNSSPDTVAYHFQQAGDERAIEWHVRAGLQARNSAWISAAHHFEMAATLMEGDQTRAGERGWLRFYATYLLRFSGNSGAIKRLDAIEQAAIASGDALLAAYACYTRGSQRCMQGDIQRGLLDIKQGMAGIDVLLETRSVSSVDAGALAVIRRLLPSNEAGLDPHETPHRQATSSLPRVNLQRGILINWLGKSGR